MANLGDGAQKSRLAQIPSLDGVLMFMCFQNNSNIIFSEFGLKFLHYKIRPKLEDGSLKSFSAEVDDIYDKLLASGQYNEDHFNYKKYNKMKDSVMQKQAADILDAAVQDLQDIRITGKSLDTSNSSAVKIEDKQQTVIIKKEPHFDVTPAAGTKPTEAQAAYAAASMAQLLTLLVNKKPELMQEGTKTRETIEKGMNEVQRLGKIILHKEEVGEEETFNPRTSVVAIRAALTIAAPDNSKEIEKCLAGRFGEISPVVTNIVRAAKEAKEKEEEAPPSPEVGAPQVGQQAEQKPEPEPATANHDTSQLDQLPGVITAPAVVATENGTPEVEQKAEQKQKPATATHDTLEISPELRAIRGAVSHIKRITGARQSPEDAHSR